MNTSVQQACRLAKQYSLLTRRTHSVATYLCPSFSSLQSVKFALQSFARKDIMLAAQDCHWEDRGNYTGEESPMHLYRLGCRAVLVGHSERRRHLAESDAMVSKKIQHLMNNDTALIPILCIGETLREKKSFKTASVLRRQVSSSLRGITSIHAPLLIAYEPVWSISPGVPLAPSECREASTTIREILGKLFTHTSLRNIVILYGGSITSSNASDMIINGSVDGFLVGGASLNARELAKIHGSVAKLL